MPRLTTTVTAHTAGMWPEKAGSDSIGNTADSTATCHRNSAYDQRPSANITGLASTGWARRSPIRSARRSSTRGPSSRKASSAPNRDFSAYCQGAGWTSPGGPDRSVHAATNTAAAAAHHRPRRAAQRRIRPGSAATSSASTIPATNHDTKPGSHT